MLQRSARLLHQGSTVSHRYPSGAGTVLAGNFEGWGVAPGRCRLSSAGKYNRATTQGQLASRNLNKALQELILCSVITSFRWQNWGIGKKTGGPALNRAWSGDPYLHGLYIAYATGLCIEISKSLST